MSPVNGPRRRKKFEQRLDGRVDEEDQRVGEDVVDVEVGQPDDVDDPVCRQHRSVDRSHRLGAAKDHLDEPVRNQSEQLLEGLPGRALARQGEDKEDQFSEALQAPEEDVRRIFCLKLVSNWPKDFIEGNLEVGQSNVVSTRRSLFQRADDLAEH